MVAASRPGIAATVVRPMRGRVQDVVKASVPRISVRSVGLHEAIGLQIAFEAAARVAV